MQHIELKAKIAKNIRQCSCFHLLSLPTEKYLYVDVYRLCSCMPVLHSQQTMLWRNEVFQRSAFFLTKHPLQPNSCCYLQAGGCFWLALVIFFGNIFFCEGWIQSKKNMCYLRCVLRSKVQYSRLSFIMVTFLQADVVFFKDWMLNLKLQSYLNSLVYKYQKQYCVKICTVSIKDVTFLAKKLSWPLCLKVAPFLERKKVPLLSKKPSFHLWKEQHCLKERFYSPKLNQLHFLKVTLWFENM